MTPAQGQCSSRVHRPWGERETLLYRETVGVLCGEEGFADEVGPWSWSDRGDF